MNLVHLVALLAVVQFFAFGMLVGVARGRYGVPAPAITGHEQFERVFRVQMNTLEQLVCFLPALLIAAQYHPQTWVAGLGAVYLVGRLVYRQAYLADPKKRSIGFLLTALPTLVLTGLAALGALGVFRAG